MKKYPSDIPEMPDTLNEAYNILFQLWDQGDPDKVAGFLHEIGRYRREELFKPDTGFVLKYNDPFDEDLKVPNNLRQGVRELLDIEDSGSTFYKNFNKALENKFGALFVAAVYEKEAEKNL